MKRVIAFVMAAALVVVMVVAALYAHAESNQKTIKVACVGDSITAGATTYNYPMYLQELLGDGYEVKNFGLGGAAVHHKEENGSYFWYDSTQYQSSLTYDADIVFVMMGTNDVGSGILSLKRYFKNDYYEYLVQPYLEAGKKVIMLTSPWAYEYPFHDANVINTTIRNYQLELAQEKKLPIIDMNTATSNMRECFPDGLHGDQSGYTVIATTIYEQYFGGAVSDLSFTTTPGALVTIDRLSKLANEEGIASLTVTPGEHNLSITKDGSAGAYGKIIIPEAPMCAAEYSIGNGGRNLAVGGICTASSESGNFPAEYAADGLTTTRWQASGVGKEWLCVELPEQGRIAGVRILWEPAFAKGYSIDVSTDGTNFTTVATVTDGNGGTDEVFFDAADAKFVRVSCTERGSNYGYSIYELYALEAGETAIHVDGLNIEATPIKNPVNHVVLIIIIVAIAMLVAIAVVIVLIVSKKKAKTNE